MHAQMQTGGVKDYYDAASEETPMAAAELEQRVSQVGSVTLALSIISHFIFRVCALPLTGRFNHARSLCQSFLTLLFVYVPYL
jgi:hypothetical protein